ncbi:hypothetical protein [Blastococcus deserti]|uniref:Uncharacterized protein n=1 Tax=Blastococcus deserti TaxID=2259033 RepID=A0ABW4XBN8_9ACTN
MPPLPAVVAIVAARLPSDETAHPLDRPEAPDVAADRPRDGALERV